VDITDAKTPGQLLKALLDDKGWTQNVLAVVLGVDTAVVVRMVGDKRPIEASMALRLADVFGVPAEVFFDLQKNYQLAIARVAEQEDPSLRMRAELFGSLPIGEMIKRGWLRVDDIRDVPRVERELAKFFNVNSVSEIEVISHAAKKTQVFARINGAQLSWLFRVKQLAKDVLVARYSPEAVREAVERLGSLRATVDDVRHVPKIMTQCGIRYVIVESLPSAKIDGVCFWLNDFAPVIGMSLRHDRIDNFWFVLRHEIEHVLQRHGRDAAMVDADLDGPEPVDIAEEERIANKAAAEFCVASIDLQRFIARKEPFFLDRDVIGFARTLKIHPGLVAGQIRHKTGRYDRLTKHLAKIRSALTPNAHVDGWGDVAPLEE
jgi:HTH-type transcriptional regulator/antitoxin HigA